MAPTSAMQYRDIERNLDVALSALVLDLFGIGRVQYRRWYASIREIAIVQGQAGASEAWIVMEMLDAVGVE